SVQGRNYEENLDSLRTIIHRAFGQHAYLLRSTLWSRPGFSKEVFMQYFNFSQYASLSEDELKYGLQILSKFLHGHFGRKVFVFIEEFDVSVSTMVYRNRMTPEDRRKTIELFQSITGNFGYKTTLRDGRDIEIYSPWAIVKYLINEYFSTDMSAGVPDEIIKGIGHFKIRPIISDIMSGKSVTIRYVEKFEIKHVDMLSRMLCKNKVDGEGVDLFIQFLYEMGFFYPIASSSKSLTLAVPNAGVYSKINKILFNVDLKTKYSPDAIEQFTKSLVNVGRSCDNKSVGALAKSIEALFKSGEPPRNEFEFQSQLHGQEASLKILFRDDTPIVEKRIYFGIHMDGDDGKVSITYSYNNIDRKKTVVSRDA
ncbi:hypothetical protein PV325_009684, partial [Microctonus aethiopoides]